jgi:hypothetical protein
MTDLEIARMRTLADAAEERARSKPNGKQRRKKQQPWLDGAIWDDRGPSRLKWAESAPTRVSLGRTGVRTIAVIPPIHDVLSLTLIAVPCPQGTAAPPPAQTNFTSVPVPLSGARVKLEFV